MIRSISLGQLLRLASLAAFTLSTACPNRTLVARQITEATASADLIGGADATGGVGDWVLSNGVVDAIVDDVGWQSDLLQAAGTKLPIQSAFALTGGALVDLGLHGFDDDALAVLLPVDEMLGAAAYYAIPAGEVLGDGSLPSVIAAVDEQAGEARLTVYGAVRVYPNSPIEQQPTRFRQIYSLRRNEEFLRIRTEIDNLVATPIALGRLGDMSLLGRGGAMAFVPHPNRGFSLTGDTASVPFVTQFGVVKRGDGPAGDDGRPAGEVSYTLLAPDVPWLVDGSSDASLLALAPSAVTIAPGGTFVYERRVYVGARNDVASSAGPALREIASRRGLPMGSVRGRIVDPDGRPFRASIDLTLDDLTPATPDRETLITAYDGDTAPQRLSQTRTDSSPGNAGFFDAQLPAGHYTARIEIESHDPIAQLGFEVPAGGSADLGTFTLPSNGALHYEITDATGGGGLPARLTLKGLGNPDPRFGEPVELFMDGAPVGVEARGAMPWGNSVSTATGSGDVALRPGRYRAIASRGIEYDVQWKDVTVSAGATASVALAIGHVVDTTGWLSADFHVHAAPSADSSVPPANRAVGFAAEGVEVIVSADHDLVFDYAPVIDSLGLGAWITSRRGVEVSSTRSPAPFQQGVGHYAGWPLAYDPHARKNGAPEDEDVPPSVIIDRLHARGAALVQLNHPLWDKLGLLASLAYDPSAPLDAPPNSYLLQTSPLGTGTRNLDVDAIEVMNGVVATQFEAARDVWLGMLAQGEHITATAASDSHGLQNQGLGTPRSYVAHAPDDPAALDPAAFDASIAAMRVIGTTGPFLEAELEGPTATAGLGETLSVTAGATLALHLRVQAPCWIQVGSVRVFLNGKLFIDVPIDGAPCTSALRFDDRLTLAPTVDSMITVETVERLPRDTSSFDKQLSSYVLGMKVLRAFTNPIYVDTDGNGVFDPPGL